MGLFIYKYHSKFVSIAKSTQERESIYFWSGVAVDGGAEGAAGREVGSDVADAELLMALKVAH